jgi:hypothetical protein
MDKKYTVILGRHPGPSVNIIVIGSLFVDTAQLSEPSEPVKGETTLPEASKTPLSKLALHF